MFPDDIVVRILADYVLTDADKRFCAQVARGMRIQAEQGRWADNGNEVAAMSAFRIIKRRVLIDPTGRGTGAVQPEAFDSARGYR